MKILKTNEAGRSMVEMLGVLAIIGVLSVAGIAGYSIAMRSHRTNEIINAAFMLHVMATTQNAGNGADLNYRDIATVPGGANSIEYSNTSGAITIDIKNQEDCLMIKDKLGDKAGDCTASGTGYVLNVMVKEETGTNVAAVTCPGNVTEGQTICAEYNSYYVKKTCQSNGEYQTDYSTFYTDSDCTNATTDPVE